MRTVKLDHESPRFGVNIKKCLKPSPSNTLKHIEYIGGYDQLIPTIDPKLSRQEIPIVSNSTDPKNNMFP